MNLRMLPTVLALTLASRAFALEQSSSPPESQPTEVVLVNPKPRETGVDRDVVVQIHFSLGLTLRTISADCVRLLDASGAAVPARLGFDLEGDVINVRAQGRLRANAEYTVVVNDKLRDKQGRSVKPFRSVFTTGSNARRPLAVEGFQYAKTKIDDVNGPTAVTVGPDGNLYVATYYGELYRLRLDRQNGLSAGKDPLFTLPGRKILGLAFDPRSSDLAAWITSDERKAESLDEGTFSGVLSRIEIPAAGKTGPAVETKYIVGLPSGWHPLNGCTFGPDGRIYISTGSMNRLGEDPKRPETPLSAALLVADVRASNFNGGALPLDAQTAPPVNYDPSAAHAPLKVYATGFRQMYRVCWHSNGSLYGGVNQNDGVGRSDTPSAPGVPSLHAVFPDEPLVRIVEGKYYGHPNPSRGQYVLMGGNPTAGTDPWEIPEYPVGVSPEPSFDAGNLLFNLKTVNGTSANGCAEYRLPGSLRGRLLICFYEGTQTIHTFAFDKSGVKVVDDGPLLDENQECLRFAHPLDLAVHSNGQIYVADFGDWSSFGAGGAVWMLAAAGASGGGVRPAR